MSFRKSIRWRIQSWHGLLLLAMTAGFGITAYRLELANAQRNADQELQLRLSVLTNALDQGGGPRGPRPERPPPPDDEEDRPPPREEGGPSRAFQSSEIQRLFPEGDDPFYFVIWSRRGDILTKSASTPGNLTRPAASAESPGKPGVRAREGYREDYHFTPPGECLLVGRSTRGMDRAMTDFTVKIIAIGGGLLAIGLAVGWWIASRALRPIADISSAASRIAGGHLDERIRTGETSSELGKLATLLNDTFQRLDSAFDEQARFTSDAAHELRTPVSVILAQSQLALSRDRTAAAYKETIEMSRRAALRMENLIESLLQLAVLDDQSTGTLTAPCDLASIAREQIQLVEALAAEKSITVTANLEPAPCSADAGQLAQVLLNLLTNAVKFSGAGSEIIVNTSNEPGFVSLSVRDHGPGISAEHLPHLFERFYRAESSRNRSSGGAGLGLAICQRIIEAHRGTLTVESELGNGSVFRFRLPSGEN